LSIHSGRAGGFRTQKGLGMHPFDSKKMTRWALVCLYSSILCFGQFLHFLPAQLGMSLCSHPGCSSPHGCTSSTRCQTETGASTPQNDENEKSCPYRHSHPKGCDSNNADCPDESPTQPDSAPAGLIRNSTDTIRDIPSLTSNDECALCRILASMSSFVISNDCESQSCCGEDRITATGSPVLLSIFIEPLSRGPPPRI
jgi:hypothetical protein